MRQDLHLRLEASKRTAETNMAAVARSLEAVLDSRQRWSRGRTQRELLHDSVVARLEARLASQPVIEQAKGVIMCRSGCSADEAFDILRRASQRSNVPVRELAEQILSSVSRAHPPGPPTAG
ncbi:MAG: ANTAR domain-containing protein [Actinomycetota bacterium]|nr:ANTAR domain-containing protein [Actinomycetota bacterium]